MGDGNERNVLDESFQQRGKSNEDKILLLQQDVNGRGGLFAMIEKLSAKVDTLVSKVEALDDKVDNRMDNFDRELQEVKRIVNEEKDLRVRKENLALDAKKPAIAMGWNIAEKVIWLILSSVILWFGYLLATK
jgi:hypothetical protein